MKPSQSVWSPKVGKSVNMRAWPRRSKPILRGALIIWAACLPDTISLYPPSAPPRPATCTLSWTADCARQNQGGCLQPCRTCFSEKNLQGDKRLNLTRKPVFYVLLSSSQSWEVLQICPVSDRISGGGVSEESQTGLPFLYSLTKPKLIWIKWVFTVVPNGSRHERKSCLYWWWVALD